jgi:murein L,D-transpeptidase YcbB/YkuD
VRVRDPLRLAELLLAPQSEDPALTIRRILDRGVERYVVLERHVPVSLDYRTAWVDEAGRLQLREDVYGRDRLTADALRAAGLAL